MWGTKILRGVLTVLLLGLSGTASAEFFVGADATSLKSYIDWSAPSIDQNFELTPARLRLGYQGEFFGLEVRGYSNVDDTSTDNGFTDKLEIDTSYGIYLRMQEKWVYALVGATWFDTYYTDVNLGITDRDVIAMPTFALGLDIPLGKHLAVNVDYTYADGTANYTQITGFGSPTLRIQGPGLGLSLMF